MKDKIKEKSLHAFSYVKILIKWLISAVIVGGICGSVGVLFHFCVDFATELQKEHNWLLFFLPAAGIFIIAIYRFCKLKEDTGTNMIISSIRSSERVPIRMAPLIFIGTTVTHLCGGSSGREGAALQIGGSIGAFFGRVFHMDAKEVHIITMCGMSAVFSALFGTPLTATIFSMEVISVGILYYVAFIPCLIASIIAIWIGRACGISPVAYKLSSIPSLTIPTVIQIMILAVLCAVCSILFIICMHTVEKIYHKKIPNAYIRILAGGCFVILLTLLVGTRDYNGAGMNIVSDAIGGSAKPAAFLLKMIFTAITLEAGFKGGEIVPTFFIGATFGNTIGRLLGLDAGFGAAIGLISLFCGVVNCPMTSIILSVELFGSEGILLFAVACAISYMLSGYYSLYTSQKIMYSKLRPDYINANTK